MAVEYPSYIVSGQQLERVSEGIAGAYGFTAHAAAASGLVTADSPASMTLDVAAVAAGVYVINGTLQATAYVAATVTVTAADADDGRIDIVHINSSGAVAVEAGTPATNPVPPDLASTELALAEVVVAAGVTSIATTDIHDKRQFMGLRGFNRAGGDLTERTTTSVTNVDLSTITVSIPAAQPILIRGLVRKTSGNASAAFLGFKLNATEMVDAAASTGMFTANDRAEHGYFEIYIPPRITSYLRASNLITKTAETAVADMVWDTNLDRKVAVDAPTADITTIVITGATGNAAVTVAVDEVHVYTMEHGA